MIDFKESVDLIQVLSFAVKYVLFSHFCFAYTCKYGKMPDDASAHYLSENALIAVHIFAALRLWNMMP